MNKRSQAGLRDLAHELPISDSPYDDDSDTPFDYARTMAAHNNEHNGSTLDFSATYHQAPDHTWWDIAWVYATSGTPGDGGDVVMCWWQRTPCPSCEGYGYIELFHPSTDAGVGTRDCPETHPTCGKCDACRWVAKHGPYDEVTGSLSHPACTGPPPPVSLVKPHKCSGPLCCPPF